MSLPTVFVLPSGLRFVADVQREDANGFSFTAPQAIVETAETEGNGGLALRPLLQEEPGGPFELRRDELLCTYRPSADLARLYREVTSAAAGGARLPRSPAPTATPSPPDIRSEARLQGSWRTAAGSGSRQPRVTCGVIHSTTFLETTSIRGWIVDAQEPTAALQRLQVVLPTGTAHAVTRVWRQAGPGGEAGPWLFQALIHPSIAADSKAWRLEAWFAGSTGPASVAYPGECRRDFPLTIVDAFIEQACRSPGTILDIGSRARSGINRRTMFAGLEYVGLDVLPGPNVDVVGDAHALDEHFGPESFDYIYSQYTFEHLLMPWKVALAMNVVLKPGGLALIGTHQTVGHHDMPWDYWRYSQDAWKALFNQHTGFEVVRTEYTEPVFIVPFYNSDWHDGFEGAAGFYGSYAIVRKIGPAQERWVGSPKTVVRDAYPE